MTSETSTQITSDQKHQGVIPDSTANLESTTSAPETYWNKAGELGYLNAMYSNDTVGQYVKNQIWNQVLRASQMLQLGNHSKILELGCGDGELANEFLSKYFFSIEAHDLSPAGIQRALSNKKSNTNFYCTDISKLDFSGDQKFDAVFFVGILHHVKANVPAIIEKVEKITDRIVVMEPNGNHLLRKALEMLPSYRKAGEDSFRLFQLRKLFSDIGFEEIYFRRFNLLPNFTPESLFGPMRALESFVEKNPRLDFLCTNQIFAFKRKNQTGSRV